MNKKTIFAIITIDILIILVGAFVYLSVRQNLIEENNNKVALYVQRLRNMNCTVTNMTLNDISLVNHPNPMGDGKTYYTWDSDPFNSVRWVKDNELFAYIGSASYSCDNPIHPWTLNINITSFALVKLSEGSYEIISIETVPRQTIWSYEHIGVSFNIKS